MFHASSACRAGGHGVIDMDLLSVIRRWSFRDRMPIREISRRTGLSRNTIRKYLRSEVVEPQFQVSGRPSKLDPFAEKLSDWLRTEAKKSRKQKRTVKQLHGDLVAFPPPGNTVVWRGLRRLADIQLGAEINTAGRCG